jgi:hypothetical protein
MRHLDAIQVAAAAAAAAYELTLRRAIGPQARVLPWHGGHAVA